MLWRKNSPAKGAEGGARLRVIDFRTHLNCWWHPPDPEAHPSSGRPPLILFLHGSGERGSGHAELQRVTEWGLPKLRRSRRQLTSGPFPFLVVAPQCPEKKTWCSNHVLQALDDLLDQIDAHGLADPHRFYLTGFSMGGIGVWCLALRRPRRFAAIASVCGLCPDPVRLGELKGLPAWIAYAEDDEFEELTTGSKLILKDLQAVGDDVVARPFRLGAGHEESAHARTCDAAYAERELYRWLLKHPVVT